MFGTIRKHQTWLWVAIIGVMIFGLIQWQNSLGKGGNNDRGEGNFGSIDGRPITATEMNQGHNDALLDFFVNSREWPDTGTAPKDWNQTIQDYKQVFLSRKLQQYDIHSDPDLVARYGASIIQRVANGETITPEQFVNDILGRHGITAEDFQRYLQHQLSVQQLARIIGDPGKLVTPGEIQSLYIQTHQKRKADVVFFSASNYLASIPEPTPAAVEQFYTNREAIYREPDKMQLSYVFFNVTNYMPQAEKDLGTNLATEVENTFRRMGTNALLLGKTVEEAKEKIRERVIRESAFKTISTNALAFQSELLAKDPVRPENLSTLAKEKGLQVKVSEPFDQEYGPSDIHLGPNPPVASLFSLSADDPFPVRPMGGPDGVYVIGYDKSIPSHVPPLEQIRSRVIADYKLEQAARIAISAGQKFAENATNSLAKGKSFAAIASEAKVSPVQLPPFSETADTLPQIEDRGVDLNTFKQAAFTMPVGKASGLKLLRNDDINFPVGGFLVYVSGQLPIDKATMQADLPEFSQEVRQERENQAFQAWFAREANAALNNIPQVRDAAQRDRS